MKKIEPVIFNMVKQLKLGGFDMFDDLTADEVFKYIRSLHYIVNERNSSKEALNIAEMVHGLAKQMPCDPRDGAQIVFNAPLFIHALHNSCPVIAIDNEPLINMLRDTDVTPDLLQNVRLPFDEFVICFQYRGWNFEAVAAKTRLDDSYMEVKNLSIKVGDPFYSANGYMYKTGGKRAVTKLYDMDVSTTNQKFEIFIPIPTEDREIMLEAVRIFNGIFLYLSLPRSVDYINKHSSMIKKGAKAIKKSSQPTYLFNDVRYVYVDQNSDSETHKRSHLVRGHFRNQPYGKRENPEYKTIWIEPYFTVGEQTGTNKAYKLK
ncbi:MAG: hypothetical protein M1300_10800 [Epsilonproteobacteria bacterium]|nr:hypothetical protein [Campylobacterota bacterium]